MSRLEKLGIQGIRSFDTRTSETIRFETPLTLIVGVNGSGKTTVIESLKYAFTGIMPPGAKVGGAFIHDPKLNEDPDSFGQIRVQFRDIKGIQLVATRSLQLTVKKTTRSMKTLDASLQTVKKGERSAISTRVAELDQILPQYIGASTAVLENVIFCHQEDSLWPLSDSATLKKKFDDIFEAQKYTKAVKNISDIRRAQKIELDKLKIIEATEKQNKERASNAKKKSLRLQDEIENMRAQIEELGRRMKTAQERSDKAHQDSESFARILGQLEGKRIEARSRQENVDSLRSSLKEVPESDEWLESTLERFEQKQQELNDSVKERQEEYISIVDEIKELREQLDSKLADRGKYQQEKDENARLLARRKTTIRDVAAKHNIRGYDDLSDDRQVDEFLFKIRKQHKDQQTSLDRAKRDHNSEKEQARSQINKLATQREALQHNKISANRQIALNNHEANEYQRKADSLRVDEGSKAAIESRIDEVETKIANTQNAAKASGWADKLKESQANLAGLEDISARLSNELIQATRRAGETARLGHLKQEVKERQRSLQTLLDAHGERIKAILGHDVDPETIERAFQDAKDNAVQDLQAVTRDRDNTKQQLEQTAFKVQNARSDLKKQDAIVADCEKKIRSVTDDEPAEYEQILSNAESAAEDAREGGVGAKQLQEYFQKVLDAMSHNQKPACRTCNRGFKGPDDPSLQKAKQRVEGMLKSAVEQERGSMLQDAEDFLKAVLGARAAYDNWKQALEVSIPALKSQIESLEQEKEQTTTKLEQRDARVQESDQSKKELESVSKTVSSITKYQTDLKDLNKQVDELSSKQSQQSGGRTLEDTQEEIASVGEQMKKVKAEIARLSAEQEQSRSDLSDFSNDLYSLQSELKSTDFELEKKASHHARVDEYKMQNQKHKDVVNKADSDIEQLDPQIATARTKLEDITERADARERELSHEASELTSSVQSLDLLNDHIQAYAGRGGDAQLTKVDREIKSAEGEIADLNKQQGKLSGVMNKLNDQLKDSETTRRQYQDNLRFRRDTRALAQLSTEIEELESHNAEVDRQRLSAESQKYTQEHNVLSAKQSSLMGQMHSLDKQLGDLLEEFKVDFKDAPRRYTEAHIKVETTKAAVEDLQRYGTALDKAIMKFHSMKMAEINQTIGELWNAVYRGNDIEYIQIKADGDASTGRRSHNYRVMMYKGAIEMDMRGRCSAGQKVLASIIIRLALAECFSTNCGIFALDEPTTNLDRPNIEALAKALHGIIKAREGQSNFQLLVITHDEEFLRHMQCGDFADWYYRISRDGNLKSIIERQSIAAVM
jgi:DNA repair protein RAD50